ncbi:MAG: prepilin-type N-terminal cleavage/methylation domain-containing protein [Planctomycetes bacterium]|nr:prepilin-type N-terminal cleavage/methylation domain-containing protein [Planctomycetota bacterium]
MRRLRARKRGFTIIEILIAIVVLVLGITGIVALFPTAIESGNQTVEDTYSATITQSVVDAISVGIRESRYSYRAPVTNRVWTYFLMNHDGVVDEAVPTPEIYTDATGKMWARDYCVLLPQSAAPDNFASANEPTFVFPIPALPDQVIPFRDTGAEGAPSQPFLDLFVRKPTNLDAGAGVFNTMNGVDPVNFARTTSAGTPTRWFTRVYHLGRLRKGDPGVLPADVGQIRPEFRGEDIMDGTVAVQTIAVDPYPNYSFAFTIKRARLDTHATGGGGGVPNPDGTISADDRFSNSLFELKIYIFKNFSDTVAAGLAIPETGGGGAFPPVTRGNRAVREFITLISL